VSGLRGLLILCTALLAMPGAATIADTLSSESFRAYQGHASRDQRLLYEEHHLLRLQDNRLRGRRVLYRCPDGSAFARKDVRYGEPAFQPEFALVDARSGYREGFDLGSSFVQSSATATLRRQPVRAGESLVVDAGFDEFVRTRWDALQRGETVRLDFLVPSRLSAYGFRVRKLREETLHGDTVSVFRLALSGMLGWFADAIDVSYRDSDKRLKRFEGLSNIRGDTGDNLVVRIDFPPERQAEASQADWDAAANEPLQACMLGN
jgi:hypothetical protein